MGKRLAKCLGEYGLKPKGFIVSDGQRKESFSDNLKVFELTELKNNKDIGIIISVMRNTAKNEIISCLTNEGFSNYLKL